MFVYDWMQMDWWGSRQLLSLSILLYIILFPTNVIDAWKFPLRPLFIYIYCCLFLPSFCCKHFMLHRCVPTYIHTHQQIHLISALSFGFVMPWDSKSVMPHEACVLLVSRIRRRWLIYKLRSTCLRILIISTQYSCDIIHNIYILYTEFISLYLHEYVHITWIPVNRELVFDKTLPIPPITISTILLAIFSLFIYNTNARSINTRVVYILSIYTYTSGNMCL